ncbi:mannitol dehydrogenase [Youhaiella tibetensis]|uniref:Mannitol dehydrogenase family protein n=1 Tax=Paradevosia tibetensis TaxID=1447062 RepID=A0A5B9DNL7_9HYPH|nr:mannitol dehydrogenase family protein [Youhaiella tibetensis]QEE20981.1 mannitol dehydrogenase family protein [Youhaiella tibetensis]GGF19314.1 mannitol dehydrogenase [Youhaiella tibetensis]
MHRLTPQSLAEARPGVRPFSYDRSAVTPGIVHLGIGAFHRAHQAVYVDDLLSQFPDWGIVGASLRRPDTKDALDPQSGLYSVLVRDAGGSTCRVIGSVLEIIDATREGERLLDLMASPAIRIVSLTVTEKGYCHDPATGRLDRSHPDIVHDLANPANPRSAPGFIVEALDRRRRAGLAPFTVMSCDNLPSNGHTASRIISEFAAARGSELAAYVATAAFPSTMVDRIVPATTDADRQAVGEALGLEDAWPVVTEPFTQWVIEDRFSAGRPAFETVGAQMVRDVEPFERMKLRMLNGSHSTLAYLGYLAGHQYVADAIGDPAFRKLIFGLMTEEVIPTLDMPEADLHGYRDDLLERFANPALKHRTWQIAMDGSQKLPQRFLGTIRDRIAAGQGYQRLALGVAGWMRYAAGVDEQGNTIDVRDPMVERFRAVAAASGQDPKKLAEGLLAIREIFGSDLAGDDRFRSEVTRLLAALYENGAAAVVAQVGE